MDDEHERPFLFDPWPSVTFINCPHCGTHWPEPRFGSAEAVFPPNPSEFESRASLVRVFCPRCGELLPPLDELALQPHAVGRPPTRGKPFTGTISGIRAFLERSRGGKTRMWQYSVSHSRVTLKIDSTTEGTLAFVICLMTKTVVLPQIFWNSSFTLEEWGERGDWALHDAAAGAKIVCTAIGIFYDLEHDT